ncbi:MAG: hypothetical protein N2115_05985 [bacterium]|nr:hypothetical protein [bacterium]
MKPKYIVEGLLLSFLIMSIFIGNLDSYLKQNETPAIRKLPEKYTGGDIIVVTINVNPFLPHGTRIIEKVPDGWDLVGANPPLSKQPFRNMYVWEIPQKGEFLTTIKYAVSIPKGNKSRKEFTGYVDIGKSVRLTVSGDRYIWGE